MSIFAGVRCKRDAVILESNWKKTASLNVTHLQIRKLYGHWIKWPVSWNYGSFLILVTEGVEGCISQCSRKDQEWIAQVERFSDNYSVENCPSQQKTDYILCVHRVLSFTELNLGLSKKMWSDYRGMMQEWLPGCTMKIGFLQRNLGLKWKNMRRECLQNRNLAWFGHLERMEESTWSTECRTFKVSNSLPRGQSSKIWNDVIRSNLKESKDR